MRARRGFCTNLVFSALVLASSCTFSDTENIEDNLEAADAGNQVVEVPAEEQTAEGGLPSPEQVLPESDKVAESAYTIPSEVAPAEANPAFNPVTEQKAPQLPDEPSSEGAPAVAPEDSALSGSTPSLSEVVDETTNPAVDSLPEDPAMAPAALERGKHHSKKAAKIEAKRSRLAGTAFGNNKNTDGDNVYIVQPGDTLSRIAETIFGSYRRWPELAAANGLRSDSAIHPGDILRYPLDTASTQFDEAYRNLPRSKAVVQKGDTLSRLAQRLMGQPSYWKMLWRWNESTISEPNRIFEGQSIEYITTQDLTALLSERKGLKAAHSRPQ